MFSSLVSFFLKLICQILKEVVVSHCNCEVFFRISFGIFLLVIFNLLIQQVNVNYFYLNLELYIL